MQLRALPPPVGVFKSRSTRDAVAAERDGQPVFAWNPLRGGEIEIQFADGTWMLCDPAELEREA